MQQINLYLQEFKPKKELVNALNSCIVLLGLVVVFTFLYIADSNELRVIEKRVQELKSEQKTLKERLATVKNTPTGDDRKYIEDQIRVARDAIDNRNQIREMMTGKSLGNENGFSRYMDALSKYTVDGLYLEAFAITKGGKFTRLKGLSKKPEYVPLYISLLQKDSAFNGSKFGVLNINKSGRYVEFLLDGEHALSKNVSTVDKRQ